MSCRVEVCALSAFLVQNKMPVKLLNNLHIVLQILYLHPNTGLEAGPHWFRGQTWHKDVVLYFPKFNIHNRGKKPRPTLECNSMHLCWGFSGGELSKACSWRYDFEGLLLWLVCPFWHPWGKFFLTNCKAFILKSWFHPLITSIIGPPFVTAIGDAERWSSHSYLPQFHVPQQASV